MKKMNLFQLWKENNKQVPFKGVLDSWDEKVGHYVLVQKIEIKKWPYGNAYGQYYFFGKPGRTGKIDNAGVYRWKIQN